MCSSWWTVLYSDCLYQRPCITRRLTHAVLCLGWLNIFWKSGGDGSCKGCAVPPAYTQCCPAVIRGVLQLWKRRITKWCTLSTASIKLSISGMHQASSVPYFSLVCTVCNSWRIVLYSDCLYSVQLSGVYSLDACRLIYRLWPIIYFLRLWPSTLAVDRKLALKVNILFYYKFSWVMMFDFDFDFSRPNIRYPFPHLYFPSSVLVTEGRRR